MGKGAEGLGLNYRTTRGVHTSAENAGRPESVEGCVNIYQAGVIQKGKGRTRRAAEINPKMNNLWPEGHS